MAFNSNFSRFLPNRLCSYVGLASFLVGSLGFISPAFADVALTRADVESLLNRVELIPRGRSARPARLSDFLALGDALRTSAASRAELRFNDGSLARLGERATFRFVPNTRNFRLSNGTVLMLIPPGRGRSTIQTPNAVTGIQGSALVVRYSEANNMTVVMALTENPDGLMTVTNGEDGQEYGLRAGEMALIQDGVVQILAFDLRHFYNTSSLAEGLGLDDPGFKGESGDPTSAVRDETLAALESQGSFTAEAVINPDALSVEETQAATETSRFVGNAPDVPFAGTATGVYQYSTVTSSGLVTNPAAVSPPPTAARRPGNIPPVGGGNGGGVANPNPGNGGGVANPNPGGGNGGGVVNPNPGNGGGVANPNPGGGNGGVVTNPNPGGGNGGVVTNPNPGGGNGGGVANPNPGGGNGGGVGGNPTPPSGVDPNAGGPAVVDPGGGVTDPNTGGPASPAFPDKQQP